jgi:peroxiredoxin
LRDRESEIKAAGAEVTVIGMGATKTAHDFKTKNRLPFRLLIDKKKQTYRLLGLDQGSLADVAGPKVWAAGAKSIVKHGQGVPKEDPLQLGGSMVVAKGGEVLLVHRAKTSSDNLPVDALLEALP